MPIVHSSNWTSTLTVFRAQSLEGRRREASTHLENVLCTDVMPHEVSDTPMFDQLTFDRRWQIFTEAVDIKNGDFIEVVGNARNDGTLRRYRVYEAMPWPASNPDFLHLRISEELGNA